MPDCLVLMPFRKELDSHFSVIKECGQRLGYTVYRVDNQKFSGEIVGSIAKALSKADLIVADLTGNNPNVIYELAIAQSLGKKVLMITNDRNTIPFDISTYRIQLIDPSSPENIEELFRAMRDLVLSTHVTGPLGGQLIYGEKLFFKRFAAYWLDLAPFIVVFIIFAFIFGWKRMFSEPLELVNGSIIMAWYLYLTIPTWALGYTPGKRLMGLKVTEPDGNKPSFARCAVRALLTIILSIVTYELIARKAH